MLRETFRALTERCAGVCDLGLTKQRQLNLHPARAWSQVHASLVEDLIYLRAALRQFLIALGAVVGTATLTVGPSAALWWRGTISGFLQAK